MTYCKDYCEEKGISTSQLNEAQKTLYYVAENMKMNKSISEEGYRHFQMAIKALEQEPCDDCVRREAVLDALKKCEPLIDYDEHDRRETYYEAEEVEFKISTLPPVYPQPKTGHWIPIRKSTGTIIAVKCECCGGSPRHGHKTDYCPNCGARMESEE